MDEVFSYKDCFKNLIRFFVFGLIALKLGFFWWFFKLDQPLLKEFDLDPSISIYGICFTVCLVLAVLIHTFTLKKWYLGFDVDEIKEWEKQ